jgi:diguanylate cyclase (GGDEF)-like protein
LVGKPIASDETRALRALTTFCVLDTLPDERFDRITRLACAALNVPVALVTLVDRERQWLKSRHGLATAAEEYWLSLCSKSVAADGQLVVRDTQAEPDFEDHPLVVGDPHLRFYAGQSIRGPDDSHIGALCIVDGRPRPFPVRDADVLSDLTALVEREILLLEHATTDELTRLSNRRGFAQVAHHILALCRRSAQPAVVVSVDLDNFKAVNDEHGHAVGDRVLRAFSKMLFTHFRDSDVVARVGGDEFAVLLSGTTTAHVIQSFDRLGEEFSASTLARTYPKLHWSAGLADFDPRSEATIEALLNEADARMYRAKTSKRHAVSPTRETEADETVNRPLRRLPW